MLIGRFTGGHDRAGGAVSAARRPGGRGRAGTSSARSGPSRRRARCTCRRSATARRSRRRAGRAPRRAGRAAAARGPGAIETTAARTSPSTTSNSCRSLTAAWWMCPARIRSAPASTSARSTLVAAARPAACATRATARRSCGGEDDDAVRARPAPPQPLARRARAARRWSAPPWCRYGRDELRPTTCAPRAECVCSRRPTAARTPRTCRVKRAGNVYGMSWFPGTVSTGQAERA